MPDVFVGAGSNADPVPRLRAGVQELTLRFGAVRCSSVYRGPALGATAAADYWNLVVMLRTDMGLDALRAELRAIEQLAGQSGGREVLFDDPRRRRAAPRTQRTQHRQERLHP